MKLHRGALVGAVLGTLLTGWLSAAEKLSSRAPAQPAPPASAPPVGALRQREGSQLVDVRGYFKLTSDRATFYAAGSEQRYLGLENLTLERIALVVGENPDQLEWAVSGIVTEYRGANYLLITKALLKTKPDAPTRDLPAAAPATPSAR